MEPKSKLTEDLKYVSEYIGFIHDNHGVIESLSRQKQSADSHMVKALDDQISQAKQILARNQAKVLELLSEVFRLSSGMGESLSKSCQKLQSDFKAHKDNPDLIQIQKDIKQIQADLK